MNAVDAAGELRKLQAEYWSKRLEHTLTHTKTSSQLIYAVDGAVLAFLYFSLDKFKVEALSFFWIALLALAFINYLHYRLIGVQHWWYRTIDERYCEAVGAQLIETDPKRSMLSSTHGLYRLVHLTIAVALVAAAVLAYYLAPG